MSKKIKTSKNGFKLFLRKETFMKEEIVLNDRLMKWIFDILKNLIESTIDDSPEKIKTIIAVNNFINSLDFDIEKIEMSELVGEEVTNKIFEEIKSSI